jgi:hypothetical protein
MKFKLDRTTAEGATFNGKFVSWATLRAAATQEDKDLAMPYAELLERAKKAESSRLISADWKEFGYPVRTGFDQKFRGQIVMRAWEVRRIQRPKVDVRVAYIITWDRSDNSLTRLASPELPDYDAAQAWVLANYGGWHEELGGERTASSWLHN